MSVSAAQTSPDHPSIYVYCGNNGITHFFAVYFICVMSKQFLCDLCVGVIHNLVCKNENSNNVTLHPWVVREHETVEVTWTYKHYRMRQLRHIRTNTAVQVQLWFSQSCLAADFAHTPQLQIQKVMHCGTCSSRTADAWDRGLLRKLPPPMTSNPVLFSSIIIQKHQREPDARTDHLLFYGNICDAGCLLAPD